ncbi:MAG TPA: response regulator [Aggregatilineales bacterium]|nr:response regulator [Aggregatilineales bacterium]
MVDVLIVDDDANTRTLFRFMLKMLGCQSFEAESGLEAERAAFELNPDLILLDIMMPLQDGYQTCANLRSQGYARTIWLTSALQAVNQEAKTRQAGADDFLSKPLTCAVLKTYLDRLGAKQES